MPGKPEDNNLRRDVQICYEMLELADHGDQIRSDAGCGVVYGTLRDVAYKVRRLAENEMLTHSRGGASPPRRSIREGDRADGPPRSTQQSKRTSSS